MAEIRDLSTQECRMLLSSGVVGRVAISTPTGPHILPVNYSMVDEDIIVRTTPYSLLGTHGRGSTVAFEIDQFDYEQHIGWSVVARGRADLIGDSEQIAHIREQWQPVPWASGTRNMYLRVVCSELTGRRLGTGWNILDSLPVRRVV